MVPDSHFVLNDPHRRFRLGLTLFRLGPVSRTDSRHPEPTNDADLLTGRRSRVTGRVPSPRT